LISDCFYQEKERERRKGQSCDRPGSNAPGRQAASPIFVWKHQMLGLHVFDTGKSWWVRVFVSPHRLLSLTGTFSGLGLVCEEVTMHEKYNI